MTSEDRFMEAINAQIEADNQRRNADLDAGRIQEVLLCHDGQADIVLRL